MTDISKYMFHIITSEATSYVLGLLVCLFVCQSFTPFSSFWSAMIYADTRIVNIIKVHIESNNLQVELIRFRKKKFDFNLFTFGKRRIQCNVANRTQNRMFQTVTTSAPFLTVYGVRCHLNRHLINHISLCTPLDWS